MSCYLMFLNSVFVYTITTPAAMTPVDMSKIIFIPLITIYLLQTQEPWPPLV